MTRRIRNQIVFRCRQRSTMHQGPIYESLLQWASRLSVGVSVAAMVVFFMAASSASAQGWSILHWFNIEDPHNAAHPQSQRLTYDGSLLFGMALSGGPGGDGVIFTIGTDGEGFSILHDFDGGIDDGVGPMGYLTLNPLNGSTLYGMTIAGGSHNGGVIFSIETDGSNHTLLHEFAGGPDDGLKPRGSLVLDGNTLFGMTWRGGAADYGVVFSIKTDGTGFSILHEFSGGAGDGKWPHGYLILDGSTLYGMTPAGGASDHGVIFRVEADGSGFSVLHEFAGGSDDGQLPPGSLALAGSTLYGMTLHGGRHSKGVILSIGTDGSGFSLMHSFGQVQNDGRHPYGSLTLDGSTLYGMTAYCVEVTCGGALFSIRTDGSRYTVLYRLGRHPEDGVVPYYDSPLVVGSSLYGMTSEDGLHFYGTVFKFETSVFRDGFETGNTSAWSKTIPLNGPAHESIPFPFRAAAAVAGAAAVPVPGAD